MLHDHLAHTRVRTADRLDSHNDAESLIGSLERDDTYAGDPLHRSPLLQIELILHVARREELRPLLADRLVEMRTLVGQVAHAALSAAGLNTDLSIDELGVVLVALEDGLRLHHLLEPEITPDDAFTSVLQRLLEVITKAKN